MLCPNCRHDNLEGEDFCENCGTDLRTVDIPEQATDFHGHLIGEHLDGLVAGSPVSVEAAASVREALAAMRDNHVDCLLVMSGGRLAGIFTERDAVLKLAGRGIEGVSVGAVMTPDPVILRHDDTLAVGINKMAVGGFRHIPIVDDDERPSGVVGAHDLFRHILEVAG